MSVLGWSTTGEAPDDFVVWFRDVDLRQASAVTLNVRRETGGWFTFTSALDFEGKFRRVKFTVPPSEKVFYLYFLFTMLDSSTVRVPAVGNIFHRR